MPDAVEVVSRHVKKTTTRFSLTCKEVRLICSDALFHSGIALIQLGLWTLTALHFFLNSKWNLHEQR